MAQITIDPTGWTQTEHNFTKAAVSSLLHKSAITHGGIRVTLPTIEVRNPSGPLTGLTTLTVFNEISLLLAAVDAANVVAAQKQAARTAELQANPLTSMDLVDVQAVLDTVTDLASAKVLLGRLVRYLVASRNV